jgi:hypothetical protein
LKGCSGEGIDVQTDGFRGEKYYMAGFFRSLFRTGTERQEPTPLQPVPPIEQMSLEEILAYIPSMGDKASVQQCIPLLQRLYEIALYDHHVLPQHRNAALQLAETLTAGMEKGLSDTPDAWATLQAANNHMIENARRFGIESLFWKIAEESVSDADFLPYVMRPEHRHLVPDFFEAMGKEAVMKERKEFVRHLILAGQYKADNAVLILHGLAAKGDKACAALFTVEEYAALLAVPNNYNAGRRVLVALDLLPDISSARPFKQISAAKAILVLILKERKDEAELDNRLEHISEEQKMVLLLALAFLPIHLVYDNIRQIYGEEMSNSLMDIFTEQTTKEAVEHFGKTIHALIAMPPGTPVDFMLLQSIMVLDGMEIQSEDDWNRHQPFLNMGAEWINQERVEFQYYLRFMLRAISDPAPQIKSAADEEIAAFLRETYRRKGAYAGIAENATYFEDWIGTEG